MMGVGKPQLQAVTDISRGTAKFWGASLAQGHANFSSGCDNVIL